MSIDVHPRHSAIDLLASGRFEDALVMQRLAVTAGDSDSVTLLNLAIAEDRAGDRERARRLMRQVAVRLPEWDEPLLRLAESMRASGESHDAEEAYRQVLDLNPERQEASIALAGLLLLRGNAEEARDLLTRCCDATPDNAEAWNALGIALRVTNAPDQALSAFQTAQKLEPSCSDYFLNGVEAAVTANQGDAELGRLTKACEQYPLNPAIQLGRGMLLEHLGSRAAAIDALEVDGINP